jgi:acetolactate synthase-1/2/3 large subunit
MTAMTGGEAVYHALRALEVDHVFGIVSVHNLPIYDAIHRLGGIRTVDARHEQAAVHMADAFARTTGRLGVAITSTGPGAANGVAGLFEASFFSSPVLMLTGQVDSPFYGKGKGSLHEAERQVDMLRSVTRLTESVRRGGDIGATVIRAAREAQQGRPQPVAVEIPVDLQYAQFETNLPRVPEVAADAVDPAALERAAVVLSGSRRRVVVAGGGVHSSGAHSAIRGLCESLGLPVMTTINGRGAIPEDHELSAGVLLGPPLGGLLIHEALESAEVVLAVGTRFQSRAVHDWKVRIPEKLIHLDADPRMLGLNYRPEVALLGDARLGLEALADAVDGPTNEASFNEAVLGARNRHHEEMRARIGPDHERIMDCLRDLLPADGNVVRDSTVPAYTWGNQLLPILEPRTSLHPSSSAIGPGLPLAIGAAFGTGKKTVLLQGDGGFMLHIGELATAVQYRLPIVICLFNDGGYGVLRAVQTLRFEGRMAGVDLHTPDFVAVAKGMGLESERVESAEEFEAAFERAMAVDGPVLLDIDMGSLEPIRAFG